MYIFLKKNSFTVKILMEGINHLYLEVRNTSKILSWQNDQDSLLAYVIWQWYLALDTTHKKL